MKKGERKEENIWRRKIYFWQRKRRTEKEEKEKFWSWKMYFMEEKKDGEGKEENIRIRKMFPLRDK